MSLDRLLDALAAIEYSTDRLTVTLVDDCSGDDTARRIEAEAHARERVEAVVLARRQGKARALNRGLAAAPPSDLVVVCDADLRPRPDCVRRLAAEFADDRLGAAAAYLVPVNADATVPSRYAALESWVHQRITSAAKDRLGLSPPALGGCAAFRRSALQAIGGFGESSAPGDDLRTTAALIRGGWRTRFVVDAVAENHVVQSWRAYWRQHLRWTRNVYGASPQVTWRHGAQPRGRVPLSGRVEASLARSGYADRVLILTAALFAARAGASGRVVGGYLGIRTVEGVAAIALARGVGDIPRFLLAAVPGLALDLVASCLATVAHALRRPHRWDGRVHRLETAAS